MGFFDFLKTNEPFSPNTSVKYMNNITERLSTVLTSKYRNARVYIIESGDPKFVNIMIEGIPEVLGVIMRDTSNKITNIGIYRKGVPTVFSNQAEQAVQEFINRDLERVLNPYV